MSRAFDAKTKLMLLIMWVFIVLLVLSFGLEFAPRSWFFHYYDITPTKTEFETGRHRLMFLSDLKVNVPMTLEFNDILRCKDDGVEDGRWAEHTNQSTRSLGVAPTARRKTLWSMNTEFRHPNRCYVESNITGRIKVGPIVVEKIQIVNDTIDEVRPDQFITVTAKRNE